MLLVIMTRSLIRLDSTVRASLNTGLNGHDEAKASSRFMTETNTIFNDKVHDEERNEHDARTDARTDANDDDITKGYN